MSTRVARWLRRIAIAVVTLVALAYLGLCGAMYAWQDELLFHPTSLPPAEADRLAALPGVEALTIEVDGASLRGVIVHGKGEGPCPAVLYFGGNAEAVWRRAERAASGVQPPYHRVYVGYRGYDGSTGTPSGQALLADALAVHDAVAARPDVRTDAIVAFGLSLGTGLATHVARHRAVAAVVLLAPYDRLAEVAAGHYPWLPVKWLMRNDIDSVSKAPEITAPVLVVHGTADRVIPVHHGEALAGAWGGPVQLRVLEGVRHDEVSRDPRTAAAIEAFLTSVVVTPG